MKKIIYTIALVVMGITASYAQQPAKEKLTAAQKAEKSANTLQQKLALTADQKQKVQQIELDRFKKSDEWHKLDKNARKDKEEEHKAFTKANKEKLTAVLTADQQKTLADSRAEMKNKTKDKKGKGNKGDKTPAPATN